MSNQNISKGPSASVPTPPRHPGPDSEVDIAEVRDKRLPASLELALDLDDADDSDSTSEADVPFEDISEETYATEDTQQATVNPVAAEAVAPAGFVSDFYDFNASTRNTPVNPFREPKRLTFTSTLRPYPVSGRRLSLSQQSKLITYIDEQLLAIQRRFIKYLSLREDDDDDDMEEDDNSDLSDHDSEVPSNRTSDYSLSQLCNDLDEVVNVIYYSIFHTKVVPVVTHAQLLGGSLNNGSAIVDIPKVDPKLAFGQSDYLIKVMGDLVDYIIKFRISGFDELRSLLEFLAKLDNVISVLIYQSSPLDGSMETSESSAERSSEKLLSDTDIVRMTSLVMRTRLVLVSKYDEMKEKREPGAEKRKLDEGHVSRQSENQNLEMDYQEIIGEVYEGFLSASESNE
ncbi:unnamed protein product [Kuraishia capsulata CBS 1993]|uniref:Uncharacterized protein n=1 Tax=Kuraishia capsulata CBS 1993 TaxID=1382522 RepID=W6MJZ2_9ASCO|nr:uncharacterized protein KUCA_T00000844001 [Kuraishia capsulata CBS 1993]CDK24877.1 unnamed protein product [Kuraishia capsulata CBS 1993]